MFCPAFVILPTLAVSRGRRPLHWEGGLERSPEGGPGSRKRGSEPPSALIQASPQAFLCSTVNWVPPPLALGKPRVGPWAVCHVRGVASMDFLAFDPGFQEQESRGALSERRGGAPAAEGSTLSCH